VFICDRAGKPPFDIISWDSFCDICGDWIGHWDIEESVYITKRAGKVVKDESIKLSDNSQFNDFIHALRDLSHMVIFDSKAKIGVCPGVNHYKYQNTRNRNVDCICKHCLKTYPERPYKGALALLDQRQGLVVPERPRSRRMLQAEGDERMLNEAL
jgi:hypothetical protein